MVRIVVLVSVSLLLVCQHSISIDAQLRYRGFGCDGSSFNYTRGSLFEKNLNRVFDGLTSKSSSLKFYNSTVGFGSNQVYGLFQCRNDIGLDVCNNCVKEAARKIIDECPLTGEAIVWYDECMFRYANRNIIISKYETIPMVTRQLRYDRSRFLKDSSPRAPPPAINQESRTRDNSLKKPIIIGVIAACVLIGMLVVTIGLLICVKCNEPEAVNTDILLASQRRLQDCTGDTCFEETVKIDAESSLGDIEFEQYDLDTLKTATRGFSDGTKLGEGGFRIVYKGTLKNGQQFAIKRLSKATTRLGVNEFTTEACCVLAKLRHKNLVKLVGFCSKGDENLLVYEFIHNGSLDRFLFDTKKRYRLDWATRNKIIMGIARGLQYLHEDSRLTIIHRDLKPANILLDMEMNPKIADFGLAKLFDSRAQNCGNTVGYMAPEYIVSGKFSTKSDVYSFGIMLLEIVSGQQNRTSKQKDDLSVQVWRLWNEDRALDIIDPILLNKCSSNEVERCIQIGLLCIQPNSEERPTMGAVVLMLTCSVDLPMPSTPMSTSGRCSMAMDYSPDLYYTNSVTMRTISGQDLYNPVPR